MRKHIAFVMLMFATFTNYLYGQHSEKPNIIIIMADDMGYSDIGCYGGEIATPNIDRLAKNGLRMMNFYNNSRCCPTRAALLTGQYAHKVGLAKNGNALTRNSATIAELLKENGYQTAMSGKWHLSDDIQQSNKEAQIKWLNHQDYLDSNFASLASYPVNRGFQKHYGIIWGVVDYFDPFSLVNGTTPVKEVPKDYYITDAVTQHAVQYIQDFTAKQQPYFLYVAHTAPHWPLHARPEDIAKYKGRYDIGWDSLRKQRYDRMVKMGIVDTKTTPLLEVMGSKGAWNKLSAEERQKQSRKMEVHAAMIDRLDQGVGQILKTLEETKTLNNTLILFLTDNGASPEIPGEAGYDRPSETRTGQKLLRDKEITTDVIGQETSYTGIGSNWANAANTPFRFWKMESFEGGCHTPMIVHWPTGLKTAKGAKSNSLGHVMDILPTLLDASNSKYPASYEGHQLTPLDGQSFLPLLQGKQYNGREQIFFEHENGKSYINNGWKLVMQTGGTEWELYHLAKDKNENNNLAATQSAKLKEMVDAWTKWYDEMKPYIKLRPGSGPQ
jgi:arylsulfatase A-like enzyme